MRRIFTILFVNFALLFLSVSSVLAKPRDPLNRALAGALVGGAMIVFIYGVRAIYRLFKKEEKSKTIVKSNEATESNFGVGREVEHLRMQEMDRYFQLFGLNRGASEQELKESYKDILSVWDPNRFSDNPHLREKANEKIREIHIAYEKLRPYITGGNTRKTGERSYDESQPSQQVQLPREGPSARPEAKRTWLTTTIVGGIAILLVVGVAFITLNRQSARTTDYTQTASPPSSSPPKEQLTSTQPVSQTELNASDWFIKGNSFRQSGLYRDAVNAYSKAIELDPTFMHAYALRGHMYYMLKNYHPAIKDYSKAIELNPQYGPPYYLRGLAYLDVQSYRQVITDFDKAKELDPSLGGRDFYYLRGEACYRLGLNDQALEDVNKVIELDPNWPEVYPLRANILGNIQKTK